MRAINEPVWLFIASPSSWVPLFFPVGALYGSKRLKASSTENFFSILLLDYTKSTMQISNISSIGLNMFALSGYVGAKNDPELALIKGAVLLSKFYKFYNAYLFRFAAVGKYRCC